MVDTARRAERVIEGFEAAEIDALHVTTPENFAYLSGFMAFDRAGTLLLAPGSRLLLTTPHYAENARRAASGWEVAVFPSRAAAATEALAERVAALGIRRLGFEAEDVTVGAHGRLAAAIGDRAALVATAGLVEAVRAVKDADELERIRAAVCLTDAAFEHAYGFIRPGLTEREIAWELERFVREAGADALAFEPIVASGPNAAIPHHRASDRAVQAGEPITIDMGARKDGYDADCTRTFCLGRPAGRYVELWEAVARANERVRAELRAGLTGEAVDRLARETLTAAGYGELVVHGVGHGVGLAIHEAPWLTSTATAEVPAGSVVTVEPGLYSEGWGGVRIEDLGVVTAAGFETLTAAAKPMTL